MPGWPVPENWDHETDVLIIGGGTAGLPAGIAVVEAGSKATVLELSSICGGSGNLIGAGASFAGTSFQKNLGIEDSPDLLAKDGVEIAGGSPDLWRVYADNQVDTYNWLESIGCSPVMPFCFAPPGHRNERLHFYVGADVMSAIHKKAEEKGVEILLNHRATRLICHEETGRVLGARVSVKGKNKNFKARKAVILATGGFGRNRDMVNEYGQRFVDCVALMPPGHQGDGLKMAMDLGGATRDIGDSVVASVPVCTTTKRNGIYMTISGSVAVNVHGERFCDESCKSGDYGELTDIGMDQPDGVYWLVYDSAIRQHPMLQQHVGDFREFTADTFEDLGKASGLPPKAFVKTIEKYNEDLESEGFDTVFGRKTVTYIHGSPQPLVQAPYYAVKCSTSISSLKGGVKVNTKSQVLTNYDDPVPGLYAAGEVAGGLFGKGVYIGGTLWPASMTFGRLAGRDAAFDTPWE
jgi:fumarate reductase flavoprotein subunit